MAAPRKIGPEAIIYDVPTALTTKNLMAGIFEQNLRDIVSEAEMISDVRVVSRGGKKDSVVENVIVELPGRAWKHLRMKMNHYHVNIIMNLQQHPILNFEIDSYRQHHPNLKIRIKIGDPLQHHHLVSENDLDK
ncbi:hypothetical protein CBL_12312 [Carabus blaptoides fortunei]